jgi:ABC-type antimicrobial peptide transport system permease subunit
MVLGAQRADILRMVIGQSMGKVAIGLIIADAGGIIISRLLRTLLCGMTPGDPVTFAGVAALFLAAAMAACYVPARQAGSVGRTKERIIGGSVWESNSRAFRRNY